MLEGIFNTTLVFLVLGCLIILILSFAAMVIFGWIEGRLGWRSRYLHNAVQGMLGSAELTENLRHHPLIENLVQFGMERRRRDEFPSYIPANKFAAALFDILTPAEGTVPPLTDLTARLTAQLGKLGNPDLEKLALEDWKGVLETARQSVSGTFHLAARDALFSQLLAFGEKYPEVRPVIDEALPGLDKFYNWLLKEEQEADSHGQRGFESPVRRFLLGLARQEAVNPGLYHSLEAVLRNAQISASEGQLTVHHLLSSIESWFDDGMDSLSRYYKKMTQTVFFALGIILALVLNIDSVKIMTSLWYQATYPQRQSTIDQMITYLGKNPAPGTDIYTLVYGELQTNIDMLSFPIGWNFETVDTAGKACSLLPTTRADQVWGLPLSDTQGLPICKRLIGLPTDVLGWIGKFFGLLATGAFIPVGGSIMFDMMKKMVNVRSLEPEPAG